MSPGLESSEFSPAFPFISFVQVHVLVDASAFARVPAERPRLGPNYIEYVPPAN
jgi:hypothetical protein